MQNQDIRTSQEIRNEISKLEELFKVAQGRELDEARRQIAEIARSVGLSPDQLLGAAVKKQTGPKGGGKVEAQWENTEDPSKTWSGRGRKPGWVDTNGKRINQK